MDPKWAILVHFGPANAHFDQNGRLDHFGPFWSSTLSDSTAAIPYIYIYKKRKSSKALSAIQMVFGHAIRFAPVLHRCKPMAVRIAANREPQFETSKFRTFPDFREANKHLNLNLWAVNQR